MFVSCHLTRQLARALVLGTGIPATLVLVSQGLAAAPATVRTDRGCYLVGQRVKLTGSGFAPSRTFDVTVDGVDFGRSTTNSAGGFSTSLIPGGLAAGQAQHVDHLTATDGTNSARTEFTVTRAAGARLLASGGNPHTLRARFEVWGFARDGSRTSVYLHYVNPSRHLRKTASLGMTSGQCGYLRTRRRRVFPFPASLGRWTLQLDTRRGYSRKPPGPVSRIRLQVR